MSAPQTHRAEIAHIDEFACKAQATTQWLLENRHISGTHPITENNLIKMLICGEEGFNAIADDLAQAQQSIDLVCWGFDPGMELKRTEGTWPRGIAYGSLLKTLATRKTNPVKVRLLIWYSYFGGQFQKHMPGYTDAKMFNETSSQQRARLGAMGAAMNGVMPPAGAVHGADNVAQMRADHCIEWWHWALDKKNAHLIEVKMRDGDKAAIQASLQGERTRPATNTAGTVLRITEKSLLEDHGTHHQKTVLIDYHHDDSRKAVGYVMGLNSLTGYWDTRAHLFNDKRRELERDRPPGKPSETFERVKKAGGETAQAQVHVDPYQDYACRIQGQALEAVNKNFCAAWERAGGTLGKDDERVPGGLKRARFFGQASRVQVVRTQPQEQDKTIRETYFHASSFARNYLYMENQYFQYEDWVDHLKTMRAAYLAGHQEAGQKPGAQGTLHLFIVIPRAESAELVPRTFDTVKSLGRSDQMHDEDIDGNDAGQYFLIKEEQAKQAKYKGDLLEWQKKLNGKSALDEGAPRPPAPVAMADVALDAAKIKEPTEADLAGMGLKVLIGMLMSHDDGSSGLKKRGPADNYRQIYIHSKLMVVDDAFFTIGSANLNQRSMAVDSEINIATDDHARATDLRKEVWGMHTDGAHDGGDGKLEQIADTFEKWQRLMGHNDAKRKAGLPLDGFLCTFRDNKVSFVRYA